MDDEEIYLSHKLQTVYQFFLDYFWIIAKKICFFRKANCYYASYVHDFMAT